MGWVFVVYSLIYYAFCLVFFIDLDLDSIYGRVNYGIIRMVWKNKDICVFIWFRLLIVGWVIYGLVRSYYRELDRNLIFEEGVCECVIIC